MLSDTEKSWEQEHSEWEKRVADGEPGLCPMCGAGPHQAHQRNFCFSMSPEAEAAMGPDEAAETMRPWEPWLIDLRWVRWIIADFMGVEQQAVDREKIIEWLRAHGQDKHFAVCSDCGSEAVRPYRERFEVPAVSGGGDQ